MWQLKQHTQENMAKLNNEKKKNGRKRQRHEKLVIVIREFRIYLRLVYAAPQASVL